MSQQSARLTEQMAPDLERMLPWENLGAHRARDAFRRTLAELVFHPGEFFEKMATSGGLHEPLTFFWLVLLGVVLPSFPLALSYFGLTAPDPAGVSTEVYNMHLLPPRVAGIGTVLLPVVLAVCGLAVVACGTVFHAGARWFGACRWEGSVSIWTYAGGLGLVPVALAMAVCAVVSIACHLSTLPWLAVSTDAAGSVASVAVAGLGGLSVFAGLCLFLLSLVVGCVKSFTAGSSGVAAALAGLIAVGLLVGLCPALFVLSGLTAGLIALGAVAALTVVSLLLHGPEEWQKEQAAEET